MTLLKEIDWSLESDISLLDGEGGVTWPPAALYSRYRRLDDYHNLFHGDFTSIMNTDDNLTVTSNYFARVCTGLADILTFSEPKTGRPEIDRWLGEAAYDAIVDMLRYGACILYTSDDLSILEHGGEDESPTVIDIMDPRNYTPLRGGWAYTVPYTDTVTSENRMTVYVWHESIQTLLEYDAPYGSLSGATLMSQTPQEESGVHIVARSPRVASWGTSIIDIMAPMVLEMSRRYSSNSKILKYHANPLITYRINDADLIELDPDLDLDSSFEEKSEAVSQTLKEFATMDSAALPNAIQGMEYVTWDGSLKESYMQIEFMRAEIETLTSTIGLFRLESVGAASGTSLKTLLLQLFVSSQSLQNTIRKGLERSLGEGISIEWPHAFDVLNLISEGSDGMDDHGERRTGPRTRETREAVAGDAAI